MLNSFSEVLHAGDCTAQRSMLPEVRVTLHTLSYLTNHLSIALSVSLDDEISPLGLRSICIEPGYFRTDFLTADNRGSEISRIPDYKEVSQKAYAALQGKHAFDSKLFVRILIDPCQLTTANNPATQRREPK